MPVRVMHIGHVRMLMQHGGVPVPMCMRFPSGIAGGVRVLMVLVMAVRMGVLHRGVLVFVDVILGEMQPDTERHQRPRQNEL